MLDPQTTANLQNLFKGSVFLFASTYLHFQKKRNFTELEVSFIRWHTFVKVKGKVIPVLNQVPHHEDLPIA
jgi:hypothetical protein